MESSAPPGLNDAWPDDAIEVARIVDAWGLKGWIKLQPFAADPQALFFSRRWFLQPPVIGVAGPGFPTRLQVLHCKTHGDALVAAVCDVTDRDRARALRGARIYVSRGSFPTAGPDEYYWPDLIGCEVVNRQGESLGRVHSLIDTGPHSVLCVQSAEIPAGRAEPIEGRDQHQREPEEHRRAEPERLIPFVAAYVDAVDIAARRIEVDWGRDY